MVLEDAEFEEQEKELRDRMMPQEEEGENSQREEVSLVSYSDSEVESIPCSGVESVKHTGEADTSEPENLEQEYVTSHENFERKVLDRNTTPELDHYSPHGTTGGDREGPYSPPSPLNMEREERDEPSIVPETPVTPKAVTTPPKEKTKKRPSPIKFPAGSPRSNILHSPRRKMGMSLRGLVPPVAAKAVPQGKET